MADYTVMLDTSGVGELWLVADREHVLTGLHAAGEIRVSALSILETAATADQAKRTALLQMQKMMTRNTEPFDLPGAILRRCVEAYAKGETSVTITVEGDHRSAWTAIRDPEVVSDELAAFARQLNAKEEEKFYQFHLELREVYKQLFDAGEHRPASALEMLNIYAESEDFLFRMINPVHQKIAGRSIEKNEAKRMMQAFPAIMAFFLSLGVADFNRSVASENFGRRNAGFRDLMFGAYLPFLSKFVTADVKQFESLTIVGSLVAPQCTVQMFGDWIDQVLV